MRIAIRALVLSLLAAGCAAEAPSAAEGPGTPITDPSEFTAETITLGDDGRLYALGRLAQGGAYQIRAIDPSTKAVTRRIPLSKSHESATKLRLAADGDFYFMDRSVLTGSSGGSPDEVARMLWGVDPRNDTETQIASADLSVEDYAISPNAKWVAFGGELWLLHGRHLSYGCTVGPNCTRHCCGELRHDPGEPFCFSPDDTQLLATSNDGLRLFATSDDPEANAQPTSQPLAITGDSILLVRWGADGFRALTRSGANVYFEDLAAHTSRRLWSDGIGVYLWGDASHVFQVTDAHCTDGGGLGGAPCHRVDFHLRYHSIVDPNDFHEVAHANARDGGEIVLMPDGKSFVWVVDGVLYRQST